MQWRELSLLVTSCLNTVFQLIEPGIECGAGQEFLDRIFLLLKNANLLKTIFSQEGVTSDEFLGLKTFGEKSFKVVKTLKF